MDHRGPLFPGRALATMRQIWNCLVGNLPTDDAQALVPPTTCLIAAGTGKGGGQALRRGGQKHAILGDGSGGARRKRVVDWPSGTRMVAAIPPGGVDGWYALTREALWRRATTDKRKRLKCAEGGGR